MSRFGSKPPMLDRDTALGGFPIRLPTRRIEEKDGKLYATIEFARPRWQRLLGADAVCERTFGLDPYGREVYEACDGQTNVNQIVRSFTRKHKITLAEAEVAVATFLKTLMAHGMVAIDLRDGQAREDGQRRKK